MDKNTKAVFGLPLVRFVPFFAVGLTAAYFCGVIPRGILLVAAAGVGVLLLLLKKRAVLCAAGFFFGLASMTCHIAFYCNPVLEYSGTAIQVQCRVTDVVSASNDTAQYIASVNLGGISASVRLSGENRAEVGDVITARIKFRTADAQYRTANLANEILLSGDITEYIDVKPSAVSLSRAISQARGYVTGLLRKYLGGDEEALAMSMMFGDSTLMSARLSEDIYVSGVAHYTAVSGAHFAIFAAVLLELLSGKLKMTRAVLSLMLIPPAVIFFGTSPSVIRAAIMILICNCAPLMLRKSETLNSLCAAVLIMTALSPGTILDAGFQMSVLGVFGTAVVGNAFSRALCERLPARLSGFFLPIRALAVSVCAVICTAPVSVGLFGGISLTGAVVSLIIMPLFMAAMALMLILGITGLPIITVPIALLMRAICVIAGFFGGMRNVWLPMDFDGAVLLALICMLLITAAAIAPEKLFSYGTSTCAAVILFSLSMCLYSRETRCKIDFVSNGSSGAAVVCFKNDAAIFISGSGNGFADELAECLRENGALRIRCIAAPELDFGGALSLGELTQILPTEQICANESTSSVLKRICPESNISDYTADSLAVSGVTIASAKSGDTTQNADIVLYYSYTRSEPKTSARYPVYVSGAQNVLPPDGVNIYDAVFELRLTAVDKIVINER